MPAFSLLGQMNEQPYALGERPGGSDIPSIPLLTGKQAWDSIAGGYDSKHMDSRVRPDVDHTIAPRPTDNPLTKKGAGGLVGLGRLLSRVGRGGRAAPARGIGTGYHLGGHPSPYRNPQGLRDLVMQTGRDTVRQKRLATISNLQQSVRQRAAPAVAAQRSHMARGPRMRDLLGQHKKPIAMAAGGVAATGALAGKAQKYMAGRRQAATGATAPDVVAGGGGAASGTGAATDASTTTTSPGGFPAVSDAVGKVQDFLREHGGLLAGGAMGGLGVYGIHRIIQNLRRGKEEERRDAFDMLPKAAAADPEGFCREFPKLAGFLCACDDQDLSEDQIEVGLEKAAQADAALSNELEKLAGPWDYLKGQVGAGFKGIKGLGNALGGGLGTAGAGALAAGMSGVNAITPGTSGKLPAAQTWDVAGQMASHARAGMKDYAGAVANSANLNAKALAPQPMHVGIDKATQRMVPQSWRDTPVAAENLERIRGQAGVGEGTRQLSRIAEGAGNIAATAVPGAVAAPVVAPAAAAGGLSGAATNAGLQAASMGPPVLFNEGPWAEGFKTVGDVAQSAGETAAMKDMPEAASQLPQADQDYYRDRLSLRRSRVPDVGQREGGGAAQRTLDTSAPVAALGDTYMKMDVGQQVAETPRHDPGPPAGQNPNLPGGAPAGGQPTMPEGVDPALASQQPPEARAAAVQAQDQFKAKVGADPEAAKGAATEIMSPDSNTPTDQQNVMSLTEVLGDPKAAMEMYGNMEPGAKMMLWGGLALGTIGLLSSMSGEGGLLPWVLGLLGFGGALGAAGHGGLLGGGIQQGIRGLLGQAEQTEPAPADPAMQEALAQIEGSDPAAPADPAMQEALAQTEGPDPAAAPEAAAATSQAPVPAAAPAAAPRDYGASLAKLREGGITVGEGKAMLAHPGMRGYLSGLPDAEVLPVLEEAARNPKIREMLDKATGFGAHGVLTTPVGKKHWSGHPGQGYTDTEADRVIELANMLKSRNKSRNH